MKHWSEKLPDNACNNAVDWCKTQPSMKAAWQNCERGDWLLWQLAQKIKQGSPLHRRIVLAACKCARLSLKHVEKGEKRPLVAIETAERWARREGGVTLDDVRAASEAASGAASKAARAASGAASKAARAASWATSWATSWAASEAARAASGAASKAARAARAASWAASGVASEAARAARAASWATSWATSEAETLKKCADIVREFFTPRDAYKALKKGK